MRKHVSATPLLYPDWNEPTKLQVEAANFVEDLKTTPPMGPAEIFQILVNREEADERLRKALTPAQIFQRLERLGGLDQRSQKEPYVFVDTRTRGLSAINSTVATNRVRPPFSELTEMFAKKTWEMLSTKINPQPHPTDILERTSVLIEGINRYGKFTNLRPIMSEYSRMCNSIFAPMEARSVLQRLEPLARGEVNTLEEANRIYREGK